MIVKVMRAMSAAEMVKAAGTRMVWTRLSKSRSEQALARLSQNESD